MSLNPFLPFVPTGLISPAQDSPGPGCYHIRGFLEEAALNPVRLTYGFQGTGRNVPLRCVRKGDLLLPGAYRYTDSTQEALQRPASCSFKSCPRPQSFTLGVRDKVGWMCLVEAGRWQFGRSCWKL